MTRRLKQSIETSKIMILEDELLEERVVVGKAAMVVDPSTSQALSESKI